MEERTLKNIIEFMNRVPLKWSEVPAFIECMTYITSKRDVWEKLEKNIN
jgi:hypothetical protein